MCTPTAGKEYSKADSRYATRDSFIIAMEAITAFVWGPLCPVVVYGIFNSKPWRYTLMIMVSLGQIYGDVLYYGTCYLEGIYLIEFCFDEHIVELISGCMHCCRVRSLQA